MSFVLAKPKAPIAEIATLDDARAYVHLWGAVIRTAQKAACELPASIQPLQSAMAEYVSSKHFEKLQQDHARYSAQTTPVLLPAEQQVEICTTFNNHAQWLYNPLDKSIDTVRDIRKQTIAFLGGATESMHESVIKLTYDYCAACAEVLAFMQGHNRENT